MEVRQGVSGVSVAMETGRGEQQSAESESYAFAEATWTPTPRPTRIRSPSQSSLAYSESFYQPGSWPRRVSPLMLRPLPEPHLVRLRPTSLRTQDISYLLTGVFQNLYTAEVIGEEVSASLIKARGSEDARHEEFVDQLQQVTRPRRPARFSACSPEARRRHRVCGRAGNPGRDSATRQESAPVGCQALGMQMEKSRPSPCRRISDILVGGHSTHALRRIHTFYTHNGIYL